MKQIKLVLLLLLLLGLHHSCTTDPIPEKTCEVSYKEDLVPLIGTSCGGLYCHHGDPSEYVDYQNIKEVVDNGTLWDKLIVTKEMPLAPASITEEERALFACWIEAGGPDN